MNANELADIQTFKTEELTMWERNTTAILLRQQQAEIEALKELNTMLKDAIEKRIGMDAERYSAHPVKELTDEEINQIVWQQNLLLGNDDLRKFARAILRKAQK